VTKVYGKDQAAMQALRGIDLAVPFVLDGGIVLVAFLFSAGVGIVFGHLPADEASRLEPIEALRYG
jgi:ABC-type antimicrobial peptide transport system permease subunit